jgi:mono/diheme cytochrome c family protein
VAPPRVDETTGDPTAALYAANCSACHGAAIQVPTGTNLHQIIAQGRHEGMPAWSSDLSSDQIDALAGFILSPAGSSLFTEQCAACHEAPSLVAGDPLKLRGALAQGADFPAHAGLDVPNWAVTLQREERTALLNFLAAPDGQRLFATNCSPCHGLSVGFSGDPEALNDIIRQGGLHLEMPPWRERLSETQINTLASYVADPGSAPEGSVLFGQNCVTCHAQRVPVASSVTQARDIIRQGGPHETMPVWGDILTEEQLEALTSYTLAAAEGTPLQLGGELFAKNCSPCHGDFGEGGPNPTLANDVIAPISSAEFLKTRDDTTLRAIISQGQPNIGMSPFSTSYGGPLDDDQVDAIVTFLRAWESNPPVEVPPEVAATPVATSGAEIFAEVCAQCHGPNGQGGLGPSLRDPDFQARMTDQELSNVINLGHEATAMIGWGEILSSQQINQVVAYIRELGDLAAGPTPTAPSGPPSFAQDVLPILQARCGACHGTMGGWDASTYDSVIQSGENGPAVVPGDAEGSLLAKKILGQQSQGSAMPLVGSLPQQEIQKILDWIASGAPDN